MTVEEWLGADNQLGIDIWKKKYQYNGESFEEWLDRVSGDDVEMRQYIKEKKFMFGGRTTANRGTGKKGSMMNCYSAGYVEDSLDDILSTNTIIAKTFKAQGGEGLSLSKLRPKGTGINHGQFASDGIVPFMEMFNKTTESISQGGSRKGALLMSLDAWHKEAPAFITIKSNDNEIKKANLSLEIDDDFMTAVKKYYESGEVVTKHIKRDYGGNMIEYDVKPIEVYKLMMHNAYDWGEPGCIFTNRFRNYNLAEQFPPYEIQTCNPCGEQPLGQNSACDLGSINLSEFVVNPFGDGAHFDFDEFGKVIDCAVRGLDRIIDENKDNHAIEEQKHMSLTFRNIGLGVMGMYDMLIKLGMAYDTKEARDFMDTVMGYMFRRAVIASSKLAESFGAFPAYDDRILQSSIIRKHFTDEELTALGIREYGLRNISLLSIAPTGSIGTMLNISTGCEPAFNLSYQRKTESLNDGQEKYYTVYVDVAKQYLTKHPEANGKLPSIFKTSGNIAWKDRVDMQAVLQNHVDTAISSTVNLAHDIAQSEIEQLYLYAWEKGLKGITIFRDGCKRVGILTDGKSDDKDKTKVNHNALSRGMIIKADDNCIGKKRTLTSGCGRMHLCAYFDPDTGALLETYVNRGSQGGCVCSYTGLSRMMSLAARGGIDIYSIVDQLKSSGSCPSYAVRSATRHDTSKGNCCPTAIGNALIDMYNEVQEELGLNDDADKPVTKKAVKQKQVKIVAPKTESKDIEDASDMLERGICPNCGEPLQHTGACLTCVSCGYSKCE